jgi:hypothetical protein
MWGSSQSFLTSFGRWLAQSCRSGSTQAFFVFPVPSYPNVFFNPKMTREVI